VDLLRRLWRGDVPIGQVFWNWVVLGGFLVNVATTGASLIVLAANRPWLALLVHYGPSLPYNLFVLVAIWRSADRQRDAPVLAELLRWVSLAGIVVLSIL
jgi:hypothetical protein